MDEEITHHYESKSGHFKGDINKRFEGVIPHLQRAMEESKSEYRKNKIAQNYISRGTYPDCHGYRVDPSVAPGTGTPEPGGFNYLQMRDMLVGLATKGKVVGFDLVEVNPLYDPGGITALVAARLIIDFLAAIREAAAPPQGEE